MWKIVGLLAVVGLLTPLIPVRADEDVKLGKVVARVIEVHGGIDNLKKFQASVSKSKGKFHGLGEAIDYTAETSLQLPNRVRTEVQSKVGNEAFTFLQVIDGKKGWTKLGDKTDEMDEDKLAEAKEQMNNATITHLVSYLIKPAMNSGYGW